MEKIDILKEVKIELDRFKAKLDLAISKSNQTKTIIPIPVDIMPVLNVLHLT